MNRDESVLAPGMDAAEAADRRARRLLKLGGFIGAAALLAALALFIWNRATAVSEQEHLARAQTSLQGGQLAAAVIELKNALRKNPRNTLTRLELAQLYLQLGMGAEAEEQLNRSREQGAERQKVALPLAEALILQRKFEKILLEFDPADYPESDRPQILRLRADALLGLGKTQEACPLYRQTLAADPRHVPTYWGLARCALADKDEATAQSHLAAALKLEPDNLRTRLLQGEMAKAMHDLAGAEAAFTQAIALDPGSVVALLARAETRIAAGKTDLAFDDVQVAKAKAPDVVLVRYLDALVAQIQGRLTEAHNILLELTAKAPDHIPSRVLSGYVAFQLGHFQRANSDLTSALLSRPEDRLLHLTLAQSRLKSGQPESALLALQPLLSNATPDVEVLTAASDAYLQIGDQAKVAEYLNKAAALVPNHPVLRARVGLWRLQSGDLTGAVRELESAANLNTLPQQADAWRIMTRLMRKEYGEALALAEDLARRFPMAAEVHYIKGMAHLGKGDTANARRSLEQALSLKPQDIDAVRALAQLDLRDGKPGAAEARYEALLKQAPAHYEALMELAQLAKSQRHDKDFVHRLTQAAEAAPKESAPRLYLALYHLEAKDPAKALAWARQALALNPRSPVAMEILGDAQFASGDKTSAAYTYLQWTILDLKSPRAHFKLARAQMELGQAISARESFERVLNLQPDHTDATLALAVMALKNKSFPQALDLARRMQKHQPKHWLGYATEAEAQAGLGRHAEAARAFAQAAALQPSGDLAIRRHQALSRAGQSEQARQVMVQWLQQAPQDLGARLYLAASHLGVGQAREAAAEYQAVLKADPDNVRALAGMAQALHAQGNAAAVGYAEKAYAKGGRGAELGDLLGWLLVSHGDARRGLEVLRKADILRPDDPAIRYHLAAALARVGQPGEARHLLERLLAQAGDFPQRGEAQALLKTLPAAQTKAGR